MSLYGLEKLLELLLTIEYTFLKTCKRYFSHMRWSPYLPENIVAYVHKNSFLVIFLCPFYVTFLHNVVKTKQLEDFQHWNLPDAAH